MVVIAVVVFGWVSLQQLPVNLMPEIRYPTMTVRTAWDGAAPEEVEDELTDRIEEMLRTVEGVIGISSVSRAGSSDVILQLEWDTDLDFASQRVRERIGYLTFPEGAERPLILRYDPTLDPIVRVAVTGDAPLPELRRYAEDELKPALERVEGVALVRVTGGAEEIVRVEVDERRLQAFDLELEAVSERLQRENVNIAGGRLLEGEVEYLVRTLNEFTDVDEIGELVIAMRDGAAVRLRDIATVQRTTRDRDVITRVDGAESVEVAIFKEADANLVSVAEAAMRRIFGASGAPATEVVEGSGDAAPSDGNTASVGLSGDLPEGVSIVVMSDQSTFIREAIREVTSTAVFGGLCAVVVLLLFLRNLYATMIIGLAIPLSVVATFAPLRSLDVSLNLMSLGGLALGIGMLVDNAVVVLESIVRCQEEGDDGYSAAVRGTREVGGAVVASTLTTVAVFLPIVFVEGVAGQMFGDLAMAVVLSLLASLVFALFFVPMLAVMPTRVATELAAQRGRFHYRPLTAPASLLRWRDDMRWLGHRIASAGVVGRIVFVLLAPVIFVWSTARALVVLVLDVAFARLALGVVLAVLWLLRWPLMALAIVWRVVSVTVLGAFAAGLRGLEQAYRLMLRGALRARPLVVIGAGAVVWVAVSAASNLGMQLVPELHQGEYTAALRLPVGTRLPETTAAAVRVESHLRDALPGARVSSVIGTRDDDVDAREQGEHVAEITVVLPPGGALAEREEIAMDAARAAMDAVPDVTYDLRRPTLFSLSAPVTVEVHGHRLDALERTAERVVGELSGIEGLRDVRSSMSTGYPEVRVVFDREHLSALGLDVRAVAEEVRRKVQGTVVTELRDGGETLDVEVRLREADVSAIGDLRALTVAQAAGAVQMTEMFDVGAQVGPRTARVGSAGVPLSVVADVVVTQGPAEIRHVEGQRAAVVTAGTSLLDVSGVTRELSQRVERLDVEPGQALFVTGQAEEMDAARRSLGLALALAVFLVYVVMASKFESFLGPLVIVLTIPLAAVGVVAVLWWTATPISVVVFIGLIVLAGIVVNNAIVLVDYILQLRRRGLARHEAIITACAVRLRPVLITAATTVLGLLPMALSAGEGAEIRRPLAWVVTSGLLSSTVLTLLVVPVVYDLLVEPFSAWRAVEEPDTTAHEDDRVVGP